MVEGGVNKEQRIYTGRKGAGKRSVSYSCQAGRRAGTHHMTIGKGRREVEARSKQYTQGEKGKVGALFQ